MDRGYRSRSNMLLDLERKGKGIQIQRPVNRWRIQTSIIVQVNAAVKMRPSWKASCPVKAIDSRLC